MQTLLKSGAPVITIVGKTWDLHVREVLRVSTEWCGKLASWAAKRLCNTRVYLACRCLCCLHHLARHDVSSRYGGLCYQGSPKDRQSTKAYLR